jgi:hypothetical protein
MKLTRAEVRVTKTGVPVWELWWKKDVLFASTREKDVTDMAHLINLGRA